MNMRSVLLLVGIIAVGMFFSVNTVQALDPGTASQIGSIDSSGETVGLGTSSSVVTADLFVETVIRLVNWFAWFITLASVVMGLYAGFLFITARGETSQLTTARQTLVWAIVGIAIAVLSFSIIILTTTILGL